MEEKNKNMIEDQEFENWVIFEGVVITSPIKMKGDDVGIYYNFKIDNSKFKMNCTITLFEDRIEDEDLIFETIRKGEVVRVSGKLFLKNKNGRLWVQTNVKNWVEHNGDKQIVHKV